MKAAVFYGVRDIRIEEIEIPKLRDGDILIRVKACGICGTDLHSYKLGLFTQFSRAYGSFRVMGHEFSGEVVEVGGQVDAFKVGDRIAAVGMGANAEFLRIPVSRSDVVTVHIPSQVSHEEAATIEPLATSLHAVNVAEPNDGDNIVIIGAGIIGLGVLQVIKAVSSCKVVMVDLSDKRLAVAQKIGADVVINAKREDPYQKMIEMTGSTTIPFFDEPAAGVDIVFDCAGAIAEDKRTPVMWQALRMVKENGKVILVALYEKPFEIDHSIIVQKGIKLLGSWAWLPDEFVKSLELMRAGKVNRKPLITHEFPLAEAREAYECQLKVEEAVKVIIKP